MASVFKAQSKKGKGKARAEVDDTLALATAGQNGTTDVEEGEEKKDKRRKDKVLMLSSRGVTQRMRHLMHDLEVLLPHIKKGEFLSLLL